MNRTVVPLIPRGRDTDSQGVVPAHESAITERAVYTVQEVATMLSLSLGSTYALVRHGEIPAKKMGGRWVIPKRRFHTWLDECTKEPVADSWSPPDRVWPFGNRRDGR